jgi:hypothetical protein
MRFRAVEYAKKQDIKSIRDATYMAHDGESTVAKTWSVFVKY